MEQNMKSRNRHTLIYGILENVVFQIGGEKLDYLINSVEKNGSGKRKGKEKENLIPFLTASNRINSKHIKILTV